MILYFISCNDRDKGLNAEQKLVVDSLYNVRNNKLREFSDSLCTLRKDTLFLQAVDSIEKRRMKEIDQLLMK
jgi:hypothetical protein